MSLQGSKHGLGGVISSGTGPREANKPGERRGGEGAERQRWRHRVRKGAEDTHQGGPAQHAIPGDHFDGHLERAGCGEGAGR